MTVYLKHDDLEKHKIFVDALKEDDIVDALKVDTRTKSCWWSRARVLSRYNDKYIKIGFLKDKSEERFRKKAFNQPSGLTEFFSYDLDIWIKTLQK